MERPDIAEHGARGQTSDRRLYAQLLAFGDCWETDPIIEALTGAGVEGALYADIHDPRGVALLTIHDDPAYFVTDLRLLLQTELFDAMGPRPQYTMFGRTYALGYESDLDETLLQRPRRHALNPDWPWAIWYPLRRSGRFSQLPVEQQKDILKEHGAIGMAFGRADYAHDVRLACHGLDPNDNDFVIGLMGKELAPLSKLVETMRKTQQTSLYLERLGPFFVGRAVWQSPPPSTA